MSIQSKWNKRLVEVGESMDRGAFIGSERIFYKDPKEVEYLANRNALKENELIRNSHLNI